MGMRIEDFFSPRGDGDGEALLDGEFPVAIFTCDVHVIYVLKA
jgi:hypothetical protein